MMSLLASKLFIWLLFVSSVSGTAYTVTAGNTWQSYLNNLLPGDVLTINPQTPGQAYTYTVSFRNAFTLNGAPGNPIIVQGAPGESVTMSMDENQNVVEVVGSYFIFQNLRLTATANAPGAIGFRLGGNASNAIVRNVTVFNVPETAFTANTPGNIYHNITFDHCEAYNTGGTGECFYVGCQGSNNTDIHCQFINGALTNNYCHDTCKPTACSSGSKGSGYQVKGWGSYGNVVRNNMCLNVATVCVLMYDDWDMGVNIAEGNFIYNSAGDAGIQVSAGAIIRNNIIYGNNKGIVVQNNPVNLAAGKSNRNIVIVGNTIVNNQGTGLALPTFSPVAGTRIVNNVVIENSGNAFSGNAQTGVTWLNNVYYGGSLLSGVNGAGAKLVGNSDTELQNAVGLNFHPKTTSALLSAGTALNANGDVLYDFSCNTRAAVPTAGAYETSTGSALTVGFQAPCTPAGGNPTNPPSVASPTTAGSSPTAAVTNAAGVIAPATFLLVVSASLLHL